MPAAPDRPEICCISRSSASFLPHSDGATVRASAKGDKNSQPACDKMSKYAPCSPRAHLQADTEYALPARHHSFTFPCMRHNPQEFV